MTGKAFRAVASFGLAVALFATFRLAPALADTAPVIGTPPTVSADGLPTWQINGVIWSEVTVGNTVYATGSFTRARPPGVAAGGAGEIAANNIFAFDITTGNPIPNFTHSLNAQGLVVTASPDGSRVYVGGEFTQVDGQARNRIAAFDTATGALDTAFHPSINGPVHTLAATNAVVYAGGSFSTLNGYAGRRLGAVSAATGATITSWVAAADDVPLAMVVSPDGSRLIVGGRFKFLNSIGAYGMGALNAATGASLPWAAQATIRDAGTKGAILSLRTDGLQIYGSGYAYGYGASFEGSFAANPTTGTINWLDDCHGDTYDILPLAPVLYTVGHAHDCSAIGAFPETLPRTWHRALAFTTYPTGFNSGPDASGWNYHSWFDGSLLPWDPALAVGTVTGQYQGAWAITGNSTYIALGGEFPSVNGIAQQGLVRFAIRSKAPNKVGPQINPAMTPVATASAGSVKLTWNSTWDRDNQLLTYRLLRDGNPTPIYTSSVASTFWRLPPQSFTDVGAPGGTHTYRVVAVDPLGNIRTSPASAPVTLG